MRISVERTGGFAGIKLEGCLDSSTLSTSQARRLEQLLKKSGFFDLPSILGSKGAGPDRFSYKVTVETDADRHTIEGSEEALPSSMRPLLDFLTRSIQTRSR